MKTLFILLLTPLFLYQCSQEEKEKHVQEIAQERLVDSTYLSLTLIEASSWQSYYETKITHDSIIRTKWSWRGDSILEKRAFLLSEDILSILTDDLVKNFVSPKEYYGNTLRKSVGVRLIKKDSSRVRVTFYNCYTKKLEEILSTINSVLPEEEKTRIIGSLVKDNLLDDNVTKNWKDIKEVAPFSEYDTFRLDNFDRNNLYRLDSTRLGKSIKEAYFLESSYLLAVRKNEGKYYPCIIYGRQYDSDELTYFLALLMIDSTFNSTGSFDFISGEGISNDGEWNYFTVFTDSTFLINHKSIFPCEDMEGYPLGSDEVKYFEGIDEYKFQNNGSWELMKKDTITINFCPD